MKINYVKGDATDPIGEGAKYIAHICNDSGGWGRGFVLAVSRRWKTPEALYRQWSTLPTFKLGAIQIVTVEPEIAVVNMIAQHAYGEDGQPPVRYEAIRECLTKLQLKLATSYLPDEVSVHMPRIGCGLGGGKWEEVEPIINDTLVKGGFKVFVYDLP